MPSRYLLLILAAIALANSGCLVVAAGCAAGGAAGYAYYQGRVGRDYNANLDQVWTATNSALGSMNLPIVHSEQHIGGGSIESRTVEGEKVSIILDVQPGKTAEDPPMTRVSARVAVFGDHGFSNRLLEQIAFHLVPARTTEPPLADSPAPPAMPGPAPPPAATSAPAAPTGWQPTPIATPAKKPAAGP